MADVDLVDAQQGAEHLVCVQLDEDVGDALVVLGVVLGDAVHGVRHVLQDQVQVRLVLLSRRVEAMLQPDNVGMVQDLHDLQLAILEALVLQHLLDRDLRSFQHAGEGVLGV
eukprot:366501-Chlamydomonas_euryale.AAC.35